MIDMTCICGSERIMNLYGKTSDLNNWEIPHLDHENDGYAPHIPSVCGGDDIDISFCLDCGQIQGFNSVSDEYLIEELNITQPEDPKDPEDDTSFCLDCGY